MKAKAFLRKIRDTDRRIERKLAELDQIRRDLTGMKAIDYSKQKFDGGDPAGAHHENVVAKLISEEEAVTEMIDWLSDMRREACEVIDRMDNSTEAAVLFYYYIKRCTWSQTAEQAHVVERHVYRVHGTALQNFEKLWLNLS